jgi:hypothetical protein
MNYCVIQNNGKNVAVVVHDPKASRVVIKTSPGSELYKAFSLVYGKPVVVTEQEGSATIRKKILPSDADYLSHLCDRFVFFPYVISQVSSTDSNRIDDVADKLEKDHLE